MSDPLSVAGSVVGIISLGIQVTQSLFDYYSSVKAQYADAAHTLQGLERLLGVLESLRPHLDRKFRDDEGKLLKSIESAIEECHECIEELEQEAEKFKQIPIDGLRTAVRVASRRVAYPFRQSTLQKLEEDIDDLVKYLSVALQLLQQTSVEKIREDVDDIKAVMDLVRTSQITSELEGWLNAPDASINFNEACKKRHPNTGLWFVKGPSFSTWLEQPGSFLWLKGFAGCGKSVLCSTVIQRTLRHAIDVEHNALDHGGRSRQIGIAFFFFTFNDDSKQDASAMLRALVSQLAGQLGGTPTALIQLHTRHRNSNPPEEALLGCLHQLVRAFRDVYIILDALDESPREKHREAVLEALEDIRSWSEPGLHLLATSRDEVDIRDGLEPEPEETIPMKNDGIDQDIASFISGSLHGNRRLRKWAEHYDQIEQVLKEKAEGVFRWVDCQLNALAACAVSEDLLEQLLQSLPQTLDETYRRMLQNIPPMLKSYAQQMLTVLCCATRPLTVPELIDAIAVDMGEYPRFNKKRQLKNLDGLREVCPGFTEVDCNSGHDSDSEDAHDLKPRVRITIRIAHFSVQEYLESERILEQEGVASYSMEKKQAHTLMTSVCLALLLDPQAIGLNSEDIQAQHPLAKYAARYWSEHFQQSRKAGHTEEQIKQLFQDGRGAFVNWVCLWNHGSYNGRLEGDIPTPLYYASRLGLLPALTALYEYATGYGASIEAFAEKINTRCGSSGSALAVAAISGHINVIQWLLDMGADINLQGGVDGSALWAASLWGPTECVRLLLDRGADINLQGGEHGSILGVVAYRGRTECVQLLLDRGADINLEDGMFGSALGAAAYWGRTECAQVLLDRGADSAILDEQGRTPLFAASMKGNIEVVRLLLEHSADWSIPSEDGWTPLYEASSKGHAEVVRLLLEHGADWSILSEDGWTPLQAASIMGHAEVVRLLLEHGADWSISNEDGWTPLYEASSKGHAEVVRLLLEHSADWPIPNKDRWTLLNAASSNGHAEVVRLLLEHGADWKAADAGGSNLLQRASAGGHAKIIEQILAYDAKAWMVTDNLGRTPIFHAVRDKTGEAFNFLANMHPGFNVADHYGASLISFAVRYGHMDAVERLLASPEIDIQTPDNLGRTPLWWAQKQGCGEIAKRLVEHAGSSGLRVPSLDIDTGEPARFRMRWAYCDICMADTQEVYYACESCNGGNFAICVECRALGAHCLVQSHRLFQLGEGRDG